LTQEQESQNEEDKEEEGLIDDEIVVDQICSMNEMTRKSLNIQALEEDSHQLEVVKKSLKGEHKK
jgi:hypothetical protein